MKQIPAAHARIVIVAIALAIVATISVYATRDEMAVWAVDAGSGRVLWTTPLPEVASSDIYVRDIQFVAGMALVELENNASTPQVIVLGLNSASGARIWRYAEGGKRVALDQRAIHPGATQFIVTRDSLLPQLRVIVESVNTQTGAIQWRQAIGQSVIHALTMTPDTVVLITQTADSPASARMQTTTDLLNRETRTSMPVPIQGTSISINQEFELLRLPASGDAPETVVAVGLHSRKEYLRLPLVKDRIAFLRDDLVYVRDASPAQSSALAYDIRSGTQRWLKSFDTDNLALWRMERSKGALAFTYTNKTPKSTRSVALLDDKTGDIRWTRVVSNNTTVRFANDTLLQVDDTRLYTLAASDGAVRWERGFGANTVHSTLAYDPITNRAAIFVETTRWRRWLAQ